MIPTKEVDGHSGELTRNGHATARVLVRARFEKLCAGGLLAPMLDAENSPRRSSDIFDRASTDQPAGG